MKKWACDDPLKARVHAMTRGDGGGVGRRWRKLVEEVSGGGWWWRRLMVAEVSSDGPKKSENSDVE